MSKKASNNEFKKRLEKQMYLAKESPEPVYDVSACNLTEIPKGVFSYCKILQKETLLLHENKLKSFHEGLANLYTIKTLDLHSNLLSSVSRNICLLSSLRELDLSGNHLCSLPPELASLKRLQKLMIHNNLFKTFPYVISNISCLQHLNICHNLITSLPKTLCNLAALTHLYLDAHFMTYPRPEVCSEGTVAIMKFLCAESNQKYEPVVSEVGVVVGGEGEEGGGGLSTSLPHTPFSTPRHSLANNVVSCSVNNLDPTITDEMHILTAQNALLDYQALKEKKRQERLELERRMLQDQREQTLIAAQAAENKKMLMQFLAEEHNRFKNEICSVQKKKNIERSHLIHSLQAVEEGAASLVARFVQSNEQARRNEELMDRLEKERLENEQWYIVKSEELQNLRKKDIADSFANMLSNEDVLTELISKYTNNKQQFLSHSMQQLSMSDGGLEEKFNSIRHDKGLLVDQLLNEEHMQRKAFELLQCERDTCHARVACQIKVLEQQLCQLSCAELDKKASQLTEHMNLLEDNRTMLTKLLRQLLEEREKREAELKRRLLEMEERNQSRQLDYWLVQYQRLLDSKPPPLVYHVEGLDSAVSEVLERAGAGEYKVMFAHHRVSMHALVNFTDGDLKALGVSNAQTRLQILGAIELTGKNKGYSAQQPPQQQQQGASAPTSEGHTSSSSSQSQLKSECVVCLSETSDILFLNCGHICTCIQCSQTLTHCPMDRSPILQKIKIYVTA